MKHSNRKVQAAIAIVMQFGGIDGGRHKQWVIDQILRHLLTKKQYAEFVRDFESGLDGPKTYTWDTGCAP